MTRIAISLSMCLCMAAHAADPAPGPWRVQGPGVLLQVAAQLLWTQRDSGRELGWDEAQSYCAAIGPGWRLPAIAELSAVAATARRDGDSSACGATSCQASPLFRLTGAWFWSAAAVARSEDREFDRLAWGVTLASGRPTMAFRQASFGSRALCVRAA